MGTSRLLTVVGRVTLGTALALCLASAIWPAQGAEPAAQDAWPAVEAFDDRPLLERNALDARRTLAQSDLFIRGWLAKADPKSGLIPENLQRGIDHWNGRNNAADNYPFMVVTAALTDRGLFGGRLLEMLRAEERLTSRVDRLGDWYKFSTGAFEHETVDMDRVIFDNAEYVKDGLMPLTEWLGPSPWSERMSGLIDDLWKHAPVDTPGGRILSTSDEVNGDAMQATSRYYWITGDKKYLDYVVRIADWYLLGDRHPTRNARSLRLRDHGCELVSGLTEVYLACHFARPEKARQYREPLGAILDRILEVGVNEHGMMYNSIDPVAGKAIDERFSDNWGYNYNGFYTVYLIDGVERYRGSVRHALENLNHYRGYPWEGRSHDGYADSIECAINLYNREPVPAAAEWIDSQIRIMLAMQQSDGIVAGWHGDGNFARTAITYALWKQQGVTIQPWRQDVRLGAEKLEDRGVRLYLAADRAWKGKLVFDQPRHAVFMHMPIDYPRINQFPEWFTVAAEGKYQVKIYPGQAGGEGETAPDPIAGSKLVDGFPIELEGGKPLRLEVTGQVPGSR